MIKKKIYVGGGLMADQLLWIIPILDAYNNGKIVQIIFENLPKKKILQSVLIKNILKKYKIFDHNSFLPFLLRNKYIRYIYVLIYYFPAILFLSVYVNRYNILNKDRSWFKSQIIHSIWDTSLLMCEDKETKPSFLIKLFASFKCAYSYFLAKKLSETGVSVAFMGHTVYNYRCMIAYFRNKNIQIISQSAYNLHKQKKKQDFHWSEVSKSNFIKFKKKINPKIVNSYFKKRLIGKGSYLDSINAAKKNDLSLNGTFNVIFLHVFKDSPYNVIDSKRIFADYYDWIEQTLVHIQYSDEKWFLRLHPSHKKWGENQIEVINSIIKKIFNGNLPQNIYVEKNKFSNLELFKKAKKIITFNGTAELEAACFGLKPIVIASNLIYRIDKNMIFKPKTKNNYYDLIDDNDSEKFLLDKNQIKKAKLLLFLREEVFYLKKEFNATEIYRGDSVLKQNKNFNNILKKIDNNKIYFNKLGNFLNKKTIQTMRRKYLDSFNY
jgi:hypothetical protein